MYCETETPLFLGWGWGLGVCVSLGVGAHYPSIGASKERLFEVSPLRVIECELLYKLVTFSSLRPFLTPYAISAPCAAIP